MKKSLFMLMTFILVSGPWVPVVANAASAPDSGKVACSMHDHTAQGHATVTVPPADSGISRCNHSVDCQRVCCSASTCSAQLLFSGDSLALLAGPFSESIAIDRTSLLVQATTIPPLRPPIV